MPDFAGEKRPEAASFRRPGIILAWGLYDVANQFFAINIVSLYFILWVTVEKATPEKYYSVFYAASLLLVAVTSPILGAISDMTGKRRSFLAVFTSLAIICTFFLGGGGNVFLGLVFFAIANFGVQGAIVFYNSMLTRVAPPGRVALVSGFGRMLGYSGAIIALHLAKPMVADRGYQAVFVPTGVLFFLFALPCMIFVKDTSSRGGPGIASYFRRGIVAGTFKRLKDAVWGESGLTGLSSFLKAGFFGLCAVQVIIVFMGVYAKKVLDLDETQIANLIMFSTLFAMAGSIVWGYLGDRIGVLRSFRAVFIGWGIAFAMAALLRDDRFYWLIGALIGTFLGSTWVLARAVVVKLVPEEKMAELFALFHIMGYLAGGAGTLYWGLSVWILSPLGETGYRIALFSLNIFVAIAFMFIRRVEKEVGNR